MAGIISALKANPARINFLIKALPTALASPAELSYAISEVALVAK
jgi:hypothetical protein